MPLLLMLALAAQAGGFKRLATQRAEAARLGVTIAELPRLPAAAPDLRAAPTPAPVAAAASAGDARAFVQAVRETGFSLPAGDERLAALAQEGLDAEEADRLAAQLFDRRGDRGDRVDAFAEQLLSHPGLSTSAFEQIADKRRILQAAGYTHLYKAGGGGVPVAYAADIMVGKAFEALRKSAKKR